MYLSEIYDFKIYIKKTKYIVVSRKNFQYLTTLIINTKEADRLKNFKYFEDLIWKASKEIRSRLEMARGIFFKYSILLTSHEINYAAKSRFIN